MNLHQQPGYYLEIYFCIFLEYRRHQIFRQQARFSALLSAEILSDKVPVYNAVLIGRAFGLSKKHSAQPHPKTLKSDCRVLLLLHLSTNIESPTLSMNLFV